MVNNAKKASKLMRKPKPKITATELQDSKWVRMIGNDRSIYPGRQAIWSSDYR